MRPLILCAAALLTSAMPFLVNAGPNACPNTTDFETRFIIYNNTHNVIGSDPLHPITCTSTVLDGSGGPKTTGCLAKINVLNAHSADNEISICSPMDKSGDPVTYVQSVSIPYHYTVAGGAFETVTATFTGQYKPKSAAKQETSGNAAGDKPPGYAECDYLYTKQHFFRRHLIITEYWNCYNHLAEWIIGGTSHNNVQYTEHASVSSATAAWVGKFGKGPSSSSGGSLGDGVIKDNPIPTGYGEFDNEYVNVGLFCINTGGSNKPCLSPATPFS
jgi:hypothetical protein